jgi:hypothetical protein
MKGKKKSKESIRKREETRKINREENKILGKINKLSESRKGEKNPMFGKKLSPESMKKRLETISRIRQEKLTMVF